jgi:hypothetical protein
MASTKEDQMATQFSSSQGRDSSILKKGNQMAT